MTLALNVFREAADLLYAAQVGRQPISPLIERRQTTASGDDRSGFSFVGVNNPEQRR